MFQVRSELFFLSTVKHYCQLCCVFCNEKMMLFDYGLKSLNWNQNDPVNRLCCCFAFKRFKGFSL